MDTGLAVISKFDCMILISLHHGIRNFIEF